MKKMEKRSDHLSNGSGQITCQVKATTGNNKAPVIRSQSNCPKRGNGPIIKSMRRSLAGAAMLLLALAGVWPALLSPGTQGQNLSASALQFRRTPVVRAPSSRNLDAFQS